MILPQRVHGSGLFNRGLTQVLSCATLGSPGDAQNLSDDFHPEDEKRYLHHYNFPPFSVGETRPYAIPRTKGNWSWSIELKEPLLPVLPPQD